MRMFSSVGLGTVVCLSGCVVLDDYDYNGYQETEASGGVSAGSGAGGNPGCLDSACTWGRRIGDDADQSPRAVALDTDGSVFVAGRFQGTLDLDDSAGLSVSTVIAEGVPFLAKYDAKKNPQWVKSIDSIPGSARALAIAGSKVIWAGSTNDGTDHAFVEVTDLGGNATNSFSLGTIDTSRVAAVVVSDDLLTAYVAGTIEGAASFECFAGDTSVTAGEPNAFVAALDLPSGLCKWVQVYSGGSHDAQYMFMTKDANERLLLASQYTGGLGADAMIPDEITSGAFIASIDMVDGKILQANVFQKSAMDVNGGVKPTALTFAGNKVIFAGSNECQQLISMSGSPVHSFASEAADAFIVGLDPSNLAIQWTQMLGGGGNQEVTGMAVGNANSLYVTGIFDTALLPQDGIESITCPLPGRCSFFTQYDLAKPVPVLGEIFLTALNDEHADVGVCLDANASGLVVTAASSAEFKLLPVEPQLPFGTSSTDLDIVVVKISPPP